MKLTSEELRKIIQEELKQVVLELNEGEICDAGIEYVLRTDKGNRRKDIKRGKDGKIKNWSARAAQIASKKCKDPSYGTGKSKKKNESIEQGELAAWGNKEEDGGEEWVHSDGTPCGGGDKDGSQSRCKPASKWRTMSKSEKAADNAKKKAGTKAGKQYVPATKKGKVTKAHTKRNESVIKEFKSHYMFDPKTRKKSRAKVEKDHHDLAKKGYTHIDPDEILKLIDKEGGALGIKNLTDKFGEEQKAEILKTIKAMSNVGQHEEGDYIRADGNEIDVVKEAEMEEAKKKKPCKKAKGKKFVKRVNGKCRSFGQAGKTKDGKNRIQPGGAKADAYCARSAKIKKCKNPPCANDLSRKKWKCRGSKSMRK